MLTASLSTNKTHRSQNITCADEKSSPPIEANMLFARCMGNVSFANALLRELESSGKQQVDTIALHAASDEPQAAAEAALSLRRAMATIGAESLRGLAAEIEAAGRDNETTLLLNLVRDLRSEMDRCLCYIPTLQTEMQRRLQQRETE